MKTCAARSFFVAFMMPLLALHFGAAAAVSVALPSLAPVIRVTSPAVVNIATRGTLTERVAGNPLRDDPYFRRFFNVPEGGQVRVRQFQSAGSGVVVDAKNGYIVTNRHVIENASEITVSLLDNRRLEAKVVGADEGTDLAVLKVVETHLTQMPLGDSSHLEVGDWVLAIGNPFGLKHTVTVGIVSALGRTGLHPHGYEDFIQTDASINPIKLRDLTPEAAESLRLVNARGVEISEVAPGSAADLAGIKVGDVAVSMNGVPLESALQLRNGLALLRVGQSVEMRLARNGAERSVTLTINPPNSLNRP